MAQKRAATRSLLLVALGCLWAVPQLAWETRLPPGRGELAAYRGQLAFLQAAEWAQESRLSAKDTLPLTADVTLHTGLDGGQDNRTVSFSGAAGRGSYIADFGLVPLPYLGWVRARAGLRYSNLYSRGALELGLRKELRSDEARGYELFLGAQTAGDDRRLDILTELGYLKHFRSAKAFYRFLWGIGRPLGDGNTQGLPSWNEMGSSLGVVQQDLPPGGKGELTVGWRTGLFDKGLEGLRSPSSTNPAKGQEGRGKPGKPQGLLNSSPFASYSVSAPLPGDAKATVSWTVTPEHDTLEHALRFDVPKDASGGEAAVTAVLDQSLRHPAHIRLRLGASYTRD